jgi:hypothetical protein
MFVCGALFSATAASRSGAQSMSQSLTHFLKESIALTSDEMNVASSGKPVVKVLEPSDKREIVAFGIVSIAVPRSFYVDRAADFAASLRDPSRLRFALFSNPASSADVAGFSLPHDDVKDLASCHPGSCKVKLSADAITELQASLDPTTPSADSIVNAYFRSRMVKYVTAYRARGDAALIEYADARDRIAAAQVFADMLSRSTYMYQYAPTLESYLKSYPNHRPASAHEALYWSEEDLPGLKPTLTITHEVVYAPSELPGTTLIASKQLYADHYLDGALGLTAAVDQATSDAAAPSSIYLVLLRRLHFDDLPSGGLMNVRGKVIGKLRDQTETSLRDSKSRNEQAYGNSPHSAAH